MMADFADMIAMTWLWLFIPFLFLLGILLPLIAYQLISLLDLKNDHINSFDFASRMKYAIIAEFIVQGLLCFLYLITNNWFLTLLSVPYLYYNLRSYIRREHLIDVTEIFNLLNLKIKETLWKIALTSLLLFISLFWMIWRSLKEDQRTLHMIAALNLEDR